MEIFISYRRDPDFSTAVLLFNELEKRGYKGKVFLDVHEDVAGKFPERLRKAVKSSKHFILVLSPKTLERCAQPGDWVSEEISIALQSKKNILPVTTQKNFDFPVDFPKQLSDLKDYQRIELNPGLFDASISKLITFINPSHKSNILGEQNQSQPNKLWERIRLSLILSAIPVFALILFFVGRKVTEIQIGDKEKYVIQKISSVMIPEVINNQLYFKVNYKGKCLTYDVANDSIWLNPSDVDTKRLNNAEIVLGSAFIANAGMWSYFKSLPSKLKIFKSKRIETIIAATGVIIVTSAYFFGKYTMEKDLENPFESGNIDLLKENTLVLRRCLFDCFMQKNSQNKFDDFVLDVIPAVHLREKLKQSDEYLNTLKSKIRDAKNNKVEFTPTEDDFRQLCIRLALYELLDYACYNYKKDLETYTKSRYSYKYWWTHPEIVDIMKKDNIAPEYFASMVIQVKNNDSPKQNILQKMTNYGLFKQITQHYYSENIMNYGMLRQIWTFYNKTYPLPQAGDILLKGGEYYMFSTNNYEQNALLQKTMSDSSRFPLLLLRPSSGKFIRIDFDPNQIELICIQVPVWDRNLLHLINSL